MGICDSVLFTVNEQLYRACIKGSIKKALYSIKIGANDFNRAMMYACARGHVDIVKLMIEKGH